MPRRSSAILTALIALVALASMACGSNSATAEQPAVVVKTATATPTPPPAATRTPEATATPTPKATPVPVKATRPTSGKWIDVDVTGFSVKLMDGDKVVKAIGPVAVGREVDTGAYESTQTGLFHVYNKIKDRTFDAPYNTYIEDWVGFDLDKANGFHSFLEDKDGKVVEGGTGRISNGCIRTGDHAAVFAYAEVGMPVWVHA